MSSAAAAAPAAADAPSAAAANGNGAAAAPPTEAEREAQKAYWLEHSSKPTVEAMMLDSKAAEIDQLERPEVLATLGCVAGKRVLELGAGIGRFTGELARTAKAVTACDFMAVSIEENRRQHGGLGNVSFLVADVTELELPDAAYDVVFSNWLLMYLGDAEVQALAAKVLRWLAPGGTLFFRESCFRPSGDRPRGGNNPTHYRNPRDYFAIFDRAVVAASGGGGGGDGGAAAAAAAANGNGHANGHGHANGNGHANGHANGNGHAADEPQQHQEHQDQQQQQQLAHLELVCCKCVDTYVAVKRNQNQICWKFRKVVGPAPRPPLVRAFLDTEQYSTRGISIYEAAYGLGFISPGGAATTAALYARDLGLKPGDRVLDVGCGVGGGAFLAADRFGAHVHAIDLSVNAVLVAIERAATGASAAAACRRSGGSSPGGGGGEQQGHQQQGLGQQQEPHDVTFEIADVMARDFADASFDAVVSRDALLHVPDKAALLARLFRWLAPGGRLLITDYCCAEGGAAADAAAGADAAAANGNGHGAAAAPAAAAAAGAAGAASEDSGGDDVAACGAGAGAGAGGPQAKKLKQQQQQQQRQQLAGGSDQGAEPMAAYVAKHRYSLLSVRAYGAALAAAGFEGVAAADCTDELLATLEAELARLEAGREGFVARFSEGEYDSVAARWRGKIARARAGEQRWGRFVARKPAAAAAATS